MSSDYNGGRLINLLFYYFESIIIVLYSMVTKAFSTAVFVVIISYLIITGVFLFLAPIGILMKQSHYSRIQTLLLIVMAVILCYTFQSGYVFLFTMHLRILMTFVYLDEKLCHFQTKATMLVTIGMWVSGFLGVSTKPSTTEMVLSFVSLYASSWIITNLARIIAFERRKSLEQERSLDDLLKVVELKCNEAQIATRSKTEFLSNMSHEIRTPINTVLGMNEMILREATDSNIQKYAGNVENSGKMLLSLINDILDFSKIESGKMEIIHVKYQVSSVLNDAMSMIKPRADAKGLSLTLEVNENIPNLLEGDEVRIRQIVTNLLTNAVKYTEEGKVTLIADFKQMEQNSIELYLAVRDTGIGIRKEDQSKLFESFQRIDEKKNRNIEGTGLGLSITSHLVELMGGRIGVESTYKEGSLFYVTIPQKVEDAKPIGTFTQYTDQARAHHYQTSFTAPEARILIVDDNAMNLAVAEGLLKQTCIQIETASSGEECLRMLRRNKYHLLLLDHMMPGMDGIETLNRMKEEALASDMPVIALTANAVSGAREMYLNCGFQDYLSKPISGGNLEKMLQNWLPKELIIPSALYEANEADALFETDKTQSGNSDKEETKAEDLMESSSKLLVIDHDAAMEYCAGSEEVYQQVLSMYIEQGTEYMESLSEYYQSHDWDNYRVTVHAVKSTSKTIGAMAFSAVAASMEEAARNEDESALSAKHASFIEQYKLLLEKIKEMQ